MLNKEIYDGPTRQALMKKLNYPIKLIEKVISLNTSRTNSVHKNWSFGWHCSYVIWLRLEHIMEEDSILNEMMD